MSVSVIKINALNDSSGNPRRAYVVLSGNRVVRVVNDYYNDAQSVLKRLYGVNYEAIEFIVKPAALKDLVKAATKEGIYIKYDEHR